MTPNDKAIITAFIHALASFKQKLPISVYNELAMISDVANHTKQLESVALNCTNLAILYEEECDRLLSEGSDRKKGYLPSFESDDYNTQLSNLAEQICHSPDPVTASQNALNPSVGGKIQEFFSKLFNSSPSL